MSLTNDQIKNGFWYNSFHPPAIKDVEVYLCEMFYSSFNYPQAEFEKLKLLPLLQSSNVSYCLK